MRINRNLKKVNLFWPSKYEQHYLVLITGILSITGVIVGTVLSSWLQANRWEKEIEYNQKRDLQNKRIELIDKAVRVINQLQEVEAIDISSTWTIEEGRKAVLKHNSPQPSVEKVVDKIIKIKRIQADLSSIISLCNIYFGPKTHQASDELIKGLKSTDPWWKVDTSYTQKFLNSLSVDVVYGQK